MTTKGHEKFVVQVNSETLAKLKAIAQAEGRSPEALIDEALADLVEKRAQDRPRAHVMTAYQASLGKLGPLYKKLAE
jgi:predicted transcriptional regulator